MSNDATRATWKLGKEITAIQKLILLSLADRAGENAECWPSIKRITLDTNLDRKTLIDNRQQLIEKGYIEYTGEMRGRSKQIPVMRLTYVSHREDENDIPKPKPTSTENGTGSNLPPSTSTENGTGDQYRKRDTETKTTEPISLTTTTSSIVFSEQIDKEILELKNAHLPTDQREPEEFLNQCKWHVDKQKNYYNTQQRIGGLKNLIKRGSFETPMTYPKQKTNGNGESDLVIYSRYMNGIKSDISLGLLPGDTVIPGFEEWQRTVANA